MGIGGILRPCLSLGLTFQVCPDAPREFRLLADIYRDQPLQIPGLSLPVRWAGLEVP
jgi:hypothetical protein